LENIMRLTVRFVQHAPIGWHCDGRGLYLQCTAGADGAVCRSWVYRFVLNGRQRYMGLGSVADISLGEAREKVTAARKLRLEGVDPLEARKAQQTAARLEAAKSMTFGQCVDAYLETHEAAWRNEKHAAQWRMTLTRYCEPISDLPVQAIDTDLVLRVLTPLWKTRTETAKRLRGRIERVLSWAKGRGLRDGENPARWGGHLDEMLADPAKLAPIEHHPALPYLELPALMIELRARDSLVARALEFAVLTAARTGEVTGAQWDEIDLGAKTWTVPAARMKAGKQHCVPLCDRALEILQSLDRRGDRVFPIANGAMLELLGQMRPGASVHGMRSSFTDWAHETTGFPEAVIDEALAHKITDKVRAAYRRGNLFEKRRLLMAQWNKFCCEKPLARGVVRFLGRS